jgi:hypothetical protein
MKEWYLKADAFFRKWFKTEHFFLGWVFCYLTWHNIPYPVWTLFVIASLKEVWDWFYLAGNPKTLDSFIKFLKTEWWFDTGWYMAGVLPILLKV